MNARYVRQYKKPNSKGELMLQFVYAVKGTEAEMKDYEAIQGTYYRVDAVNGPLWFSRKFVGDNVKLNFSSPNAQGVRKIYADTSEMDKMESIVKQYGGDFGQALATMGAAKLLNIHPTATPSAPQAPTPPPADSVKDSSADVDFDNL